MTTTLLDLKGYGRWVAEAGERRLLRGSGNNHSLELLGTLVDMLSVGVGR